MNEGTINNMPPAPLLSNNIANLETNVEALEQLTGMLKAGLNEIIRDNDSGKAIQEKVDSNPDNALDKFRLLNARLQTVVANIKNLKQHLERII